MIIKKNNFIEEENYLPQNPETGDPIILVPKRWLRRISWINYEDYLNSYYIQEVLKKGGNKPDRVALLNYNRYNYDVVQTYIKIKEEILCRSYSKGPKPPEIGIER